MWVGSEPAAVTRRQHSKLVLVDLAGSERMGRAASSSSTTSTTSTPHTKRQQAGSMMRVAEARSINSSLSALGNVIAALAESSGSSSVASRLHIPYRASASSACSSSAIARITMKRYRDALRYVDGVMAHRTRS